MEIKTIGDTKKFAIQTCISSVTYTQKWNQLPGVLFLTSKTFLADVKVKRGENSAQRGTELVKQVLSDGAPQKSPCKIEIKSTAH